MLGLCFCARAFPSCGKWGPLFITVRGPLTIAASLVAEHRLQTRRLSSCGSRAQSLRGMWDLPRPGLEPVSPALAGRFSTTAPPGKPFKEIFEKKKRNITYSSSSQPSHSILATRKNKYKWINKSYSQKAQYHFHPCLYLDIFYIVTIRAETIFILPFFSICYINLFHVSLQLLLFSFEMAVYFSIKGLGHDLLNPFPNTGRLGCFSIIFGMCMLFGAYVCVCVFILSL